MPAMRATSFSGSDQMNETVCSNVTAPGLGDFKKPQLAALIEAWSGSIDVIGCGAPPVRNAPKPGFRSSISPVDVGDLLVMGVNFSRNRFVRSRRRIAADGLDYYQIQLVEKGAVEGMAADRQLAVYAGDVQLLDLTQTHSATTSDCETIVLLVPRDMVHAVLPASRDLHGLVVRGQMVIGELLGDFMRSLQRRLDSTTVQDPSVLARAIIEMVGACFQPSVSVPALPAPTIDNVLASRLKYYVSQNLASPALTPASLCQLFHISRRQLYRIFEREGGLLKYIRGQRLERAFNQLSEPVGKYRRVSQVAYSLGFKVPLQPRLPFRFRPEPTRGSSASPLTIDDRRRTWKRFDFEFHVVVDGGPLLDESNPGLTDRHRSSRASAGSPKLPNSKPPFVSRRGSAILGGSSHD
jgi:AraC-like DNA-binding protein